MSHCSVLKIWDGIQPLDLFSRGFPEDYENLIIQLDNLLLQMNDYN